MTTNNDPWADFFLPEEVAAPTSRYNHYGGGQSLPALEQLAWAEMEEEEFVARAANEVWRRPNGFKGNIGSGRVGVSRSKAQKIVALVGKHLPPREKKRLADLVLERAEALFLLACKAWAHEALKLALQHKADEEIITMARIKACAQAIVPKGGLGPTLDVIRARLAE